MLPELLPRPQPVLAAVLFGTMGVLLLSYDFDDRGPHFGVPPAAAKFDRAGTYDLSRARLLTKVMGHVRSHYVSPDRVAPKKMAVAALQSIQAIVPEVRVKVTRRGAAKRPTALDVWVADEQRNFGLERVGDLYELGWKLMDIFDFLQRRLPPTTDLEPIEYAAVNGILETLDPHSVLLTPHVYREMQLGTQGRFGGLGIVISIRAGVLTVMSVMSGTPAARAGLESGDRIMQIGEESTINMPLNDAVNRLRGEPGTDVTIWIKRASAPDLESYTITREEIRIQAVEHESMEAGIGYVRIQRFQGNADEDLSDAIDDLKVQPQGLAGLILDLRENPGGLLDQAIKISDRFLDDGTIVATVREGARQREVRHATRAGTLADVPMVVLINKGSASASEIVAGALKHNDRALILGETSFGKGTVQVLYQIDDAALKLTIAQYLTPGDISIQSVGIVPDIEIHRLRLTEKRIDLVPDSFEYQGEAGLESHLESAKAGAVKSSLRLHLFEKPDKEDKDEAPGDDEAFRPDRLVGLAHGILVAAPQANRKRALVQASGLLAQVQAEEDRQVAERLGAMGVDWRRGAPDEKTAPRPEVTLKTRIVGADKPRRPRAGDAIELTATVTVTDRRPLWRLHGVLSSHISALDGQEFVFGHVDGKSPRTWSTKVELPKSLVTQGDLLGLALLSDGKPVGRPVELPLEVNALPAPRFAYVALARDDGGNGDGLIQRGERIAVDVIITNVGEGGASDVLVTVKNESGEQVYIQEGRQRLGAIASGAGAVATFLLEVKDGLAAQDVQLELAIVDQTRRIWYQTDLAFPVFPTEFPAARRDRWTGTVTQGTVSVRTGAHEDAASWAEAAEGAVLAVQSRAGDWLEVRLTAEDGPLSSGWIPADRLEASAGKPTYDQVRFAPKRAPPALSLDQDPGIPLIQPGRQTTIRGRAEFEDGASGRRDLYVFLGQEKVYFVQADKAEFDFEVPVTLEKDRNVISVVARQGEHDVTRRSIVIYRR